MNDCADTTYSELAHKALLNVVLRNTRLLARLRVTARMDSAAIRALESQRIENLAALDMFAEDEAGGFLLDTAGALREEVQP